MLSVLRARRLPITASELGAELGISKRSVYRDIDTLRLLGAPLDGQAGMGYLLRDGFFLPQFAFTAEEMDALILGLGWVRQRGDPTMAKGSDSALAKILSASGEANTFADALPPQFSAASVSERTDPPLVQPLRVATRLQRKVTIDYADAQGRLTHRTLWPIAIVYFDDVRVLAAWCEHRSAFRHFRVDRIKAAQVSDERYPERRHSLFRRWRAQDRNWRALLTVSDTPTS